MLISHRVPPLRGVKQGRVGKQAIFEVNASISRKRLNPVWHRMLYSCTHVATVGVNGLSGNML